MAKYAKNIFYVEARVHICSAQRNTNKYIALLLNPKHMALLRKIIKYVIGLHDVQQLQTQHPSLTVKTINFKELSTNQKHRHCSQILKSYWIAESNKQSIRNSSSINSTDRQRGHEMKSSCMLLFE